MKFSTLNVFFLAGLLIANCTPSTSDTTSTLQATRDNLPQSGELNQLCLSKIAGVIVAPYISGPNVDPDFEPTALIIAAPKKLRQDTNVKQGKVDVYSVSSSYKSGSGVDEFYIKSGTCDIIKKVTTFSE